MATIMEIARMSETEARQYLEGIRWPDGKPVCAHCGSTRCGALANVKDKKGNPRTGLYKCYACRKQFTVTTNTCMHGSHLSLQQWIVAFYMVCSGKKGVAALELKRVLGIGSMKCAWHLVHRIREAMAETFDTPFAGIVETDETWIGGKISGRASARDNKTAVMAIAERGGSLIAKPLPNRQQSVLVGELEAVVSPTAEIHTDENQVYKRVIRQSFAKHERVNHSKKEYSRDGVHCNTCESYFGLLKRGIHGTFHQVSAKHLHRYCNEFSFRWNRRKVTDTQRAESLMASVMNRRLRFRDLVDGTRAR